MTEGEVYSSSKCCDCIITTIIPCKKLFAKTRQKLCIVAHPGRVDTMVVRACLWQVEGYNFVLYKWHNIETRGASFFGVGFPDWVHRSTRSVETWMRQTGCSLRQTRLPKWYVHCFCTHHTYVLP